MKSLFSKTELFLIKNNKKFVLDLDEDGHLANSIEKEGKSYT